MTRARRVRWTPVVAALVLVLLALVPLAQLVDARTVPGGTEAVTATVLDDAEVTTRSDARGGGHLVALELPDGEQATTALGWRLDYPDAGDTLTVYREDDVWRSTSETSWLEVAGGLLLAAVLLVGLVGYVRRARRPR